MNEYILPINVKVNVKEKTGVLQNSLKGAGLGVLHFIAFFFMLQLQSLLHQNGHSRGNGRGICMETWKIWCLFQTKEMTPE